MPIICHNHHYHLITGKN